MEQRGLNLQKGESVSQIREGKREGGQVVKRGKEETYLGIIAVSTLEYVW